MHESPEPPASAESLPPRYGQALRRGALINAFGLLAKLAGPLLVLVVTRAFGPAVAGVFLLTQTVAEIARSAAVAGYFDAVTIFGSRALGIDATSDATQSPEQLRAADTRACAVIGAGMRAALAITLVLGAAAVVFAEPLARLFPALDGLATAIRYAGASLPLLAFGQLATAATKAKLHMEYDVAIWSFGRPLGLLLAALVAGALSTGLPGLMLGWLVVHALLALVAAWALSRCFPLGEVLAACLRPANVPGLHRFALPQNLNMTFNRTQARMDVLALGMLGYSSAAVAFYATGALIASSLQEIRMVFSSALAPVVGRLHGASDKSALEELLAKVSRWTTSLAIPLCVLALIWRAEILALVDPSYVGDSRYVALLLLAVLVNCSLGLAGNYLVFTGHAAFNLLNSVLVAGLSAGLSFALIPAHGLLGAAAATCAASLAVALAQLIEVRVLEGIRLLVRRIYKPYVGLAALLALLALVGDPAKLGGALALLLASAVALLAYGAVLFLLRHEELIAWSKGRPAVPPASTATTLGDVREP